MGEVGEWRGGEDIDREVELGESSNNLRCPNDELTSTFACTLFPARRKDMTGFTWHL